jgi:hypothetical protein
MWRRNVMPWYTHAEFAKYAFLAEREQRLARLVAATYAALLSLSLAIIIVPLMAVLSRRVASTAKDAE